MLCQVHFPDFFFALQPTKLLSQMRRTSIALAIPEDSELSIPIAMTTSQEGSSSPQLTVTGIDRGQEYEVQDESGIRGEETKELLTTVSFLVSKSSV